MHICIFVANRGKITKKSRQIRFFSLLLQNLTKEVLHFPEIYSNFAASNRFEFIKLRNNLKNLMTMKRYITKVTLAFILGGLLASCSHDEDYYGSLVQDKLQTYEKVFVQEFGAISPDQDWGFGDSDVTIPDVINARTRTDVIKYDMTNYPMATNPAAITDYEREYVTKWFQTNQGLSEQGLDISNFYIQWVSGDTDNKLGLWHRYDPNRKDADGNPDTDWDEVFSDNGGMDYLLIGATPETAVSTHGLDFNAKGGGPWGIIYVQDGSALQFGYHSSWDNNDYYYFKLATIDVPGVGTGYYVGLSLYGKKYDNGDKELGIQRLQFAEDWILKIVPGNTTPVEPGEITIPVDNHGETTPQIPIYEHQKIYKRTKLIDSARILCEDLGNVERNDIDFNDVVFDAYIYEEKDSIITARVQNNVEGSPSTEVSEPRYYATLVILAAGGTLQLTLANVEDVHNAFGTGIETLINTARNTDEAHFNPFMWTGDTVRVDRIDGIRRIEDILISVKVSEETLKLESWKGHAPHKLRVDIGTPWPRERCAIGDVYEDFSKYVAKELDTFWNGKKDDSKLYNITYNPLPNLKEELISNSTYGIGYEDGEKTEWGGYQGGEVLIRIRN